MCETLFQLPSDYVPTREQAHAENLLTLLEAAKLLDIGVLDLVDEARDGRIDITAKFNRVPCFSLRAIDDYRRGHARAS